MAIEINGRKFEKRNGKIFEIEEREVDLDKLQKDVDRLERRVNNMPQPKEVPKDADTDTKEAIAFWNDGVAEKDSRERINKELEQKKDLINRLKRLK